MACVTLTIRISASVMSSAPSGSTRSRAKIWVPALTPSTETSILSGMWVASTASANVLFSSVTTVSTAAAPTTWTGTSTVTFSPRRTTTRSMWSMNRVSTSRWTSLARASWSLPSISTVRRALASLRAIIVWWPGRQMCTGSVPWPYMTAGMLPSRRTARAAPLPKDVRIVATSLLSDMGVLLHCVVRIRQPVGTACTGGLCVIAVRWASTRDAVRRRQQAWRARSTLKNGASGATASITDFCINRFGLHQLQSCSVPRRGNLRSVGEPVRHTEIQRLSAT